MCWSSKDTQDRKLHQPAQTHQLTMDDLPEEEALPLFPMGQHNSSPITGPLYVETPKNGRFDTFLSSAVSLSR